MSRRRVVLGFGVSMIDRLVIGFTQLALIPILASHWGLVRFGSWSMLTTVPGLLALGDLGFISAAAVRMTMEVARGEYQDANKTLHSASQIVGLACLVILLVIGAAALLLSDRALLADAGTSVAAMRLTLVLLGCYAALVLLCGIFQGILRSTSRFAVGIALSTVTFALENGLLVFVVFTGRGLVAGAAALVAGRALGLCLQAATVLHLKTGLVPGFSRGCAKIRRELLGPALAAMSIPLATAMLLQGTVAALGFVAGAALVPAYVAARTLSRLGLQASQMLATVLMPEFGSAAAKDDRTGSMRMVALVLLFGSAIAIPFAVMLGLVGPQLVGLWSRQHIIASEGLMLAIAMSALCGGIWLPVSNLMLAVNRQAEFAIAYAVLAAGGVVLTVVLGKSLGSTAPALALALVDLAMLLIVGRFVIRNWAGSGTLANVLRNLPGELWADVTGLLRKFRR